MMKKILFLFSCLFVSLMAFGQENGWKKGDSILLPNVRFITPGVIHLYPFMDKETRLIGFVRASSDLFVIIPPIYESVYNDIYLLLAVKRDGKWGAMDLGERYMSNDYYNQLDPIIPCIYDHVEVVDDNHAKVTKAGKTSIIDIREGKMTVNEFFDSKR